MNDKIVHKHPGNKFNIGERAIYKNSSVEFEIIAIHIYTDEIRYDIQIIKHIIRHVHEKELKEC